MPTIKDVATKVGVSAATVSRVLNGEKVSADTKEKVLKAIKHIGYHPNPIARSLRTQKTQTIGFVVPDYGPFFMQIAKVVEDVLSRYGYSMLVCYSDENPEKEMARIKMLMEKQVDGMLIAPTSDQDDYLVKINERGIPIILIDRMLKDLQIDRVLVDNVNGAYQAVEHLITKKYRRIGIINGRQEVTTGEERYRGYLRVLEDYNLLIDRDIIRFGDFSAESGYKLMKELMCLSDPPAAVFVTNCYMTIGAMLTMKEMGIKVPDDVAIVSFDDSELMQLSTPPITSVVQPVQEMGEKAAQLIYKRISGDNVGFPQLYRLKPELIIRSSSNPTQKIKKPDGN